jgi:hypothetical protein
LGWFDDGLLLHFVSSAIAGFLAVVGGSPADVVKSRCIDGLRIDANTIKYYSSIRECTVKVYELYGWRGFYAGFGANVYRLVIWNIIMFVTREQIKMKIMGRKNK